MYQLHYDPEFLYRGAIEIGKQMFLDVRRDYISWLNMYTSKHRFELEELLKEEMSIPEIAKKIGVSPGTIANWKNQLHKRDEVWAFFFSNSSLYYEFMPSTDPWQIIDKYETEYWEPIFFPKESKLKKGVRKE